MVKKLVVCCDGTWNTPRTGTNIFRTYRFLRERLGDPRESKRGEGVRTCAGNAKDGSPVTLFYDEGVGTNWFDRLLGGTTGEGLSDNVRDAYHFLANQFEPGAEIYVFGFSRGAYTARSLCGFIKAAGLLVRPTERDVHRAYVDFYATEDRVVHRRSGWSFADVNKWLTDQIGDLVTRGPDTDLKNAPRHQGVKIRFIGVYDTVGALGVPIPNAQTVNDAIVGFHDTSTSDIIEHAVHALAVDEKRGPYVPTLWTLAPGKTLEPGQTVLQVWFPGVHSDIGGGYKDKGIGNHTLGFMLRQAAQRGLVLDPDQQVPSAPEHTPSPLPAQHESLDGAWRLLSQKLRIVPDGTRSIGTTVRGQAGEMLRAAGDVRFHPLLQDRFEKQVDVILDEDRGQRTAQPYRPSNASSGLLPLFV